MSTHPSHAQGRELARHARDAFMRSHGLAVGSRRLLLPTLPRLPTRADLAGGAGAKKARADPELRQGAPGTQTWVVSVCAPQWHEAGVKGSQNTSLATKQKGAPSHGINALRSNEGLMTVMRRELLTFTNKEIADGGITDGKWLSEEAADKLRSTLFGRRSKLQQMLLECLDQILGSGDPVLRGATNVYAMLHFQRQADVRGSGRRRGLADRVVHGTATKYAATPLSVLLGEEVAAPPPRGSCMVDAIHAALGHAAWKLQHAAHACNQLGDASPAGIVASITAYRHEEQHGPLTLWVAADGAEGVAAGPIDSPAALRKLREQRCMHAAVHGHMNVAWSGAANKSPPLVVPPYAPGVAFGCTAREALEAVFRPARAGVDFVDHSGALQLGYRPESTEHKGVTRILLSPGHAELVSSSVDSISQTAGRATVRDTMQAVTSTFEKATVPAARARKQAHAGTTGTRATRGAAAVAAAAMNTEDVPLTSVVPVSAPQPPLPALINVGVNVSVPKTTASAQWVDGACALAGVVWGASGGRSEPAIVKLCGNVDLAEEARLLRQRGAHVTECSDGSNNVDELRFYVSLSVPAAKLAERRALEERHAAAMAISDKYRSATAATSAERTYIAAMGRIAKLEARDSAEPAASEPRAEQGNKRRRTVPPPPALPPPSTDPVLIRCVSLRSIGLEGERAVPVHNAATHDAFTRRYTANTRALLSPISKYSGEKHWGGDFDVPPVCDGMLWHFHQGFVAPLTMCDPAACADTRDGTIVLHDLTFAYPFLLRKACADLKAAPIFTSFDTMQPFPRADAVNDCVIDAWRALTPAARKVHFKRAAAYIDKYAFYAIETDGELPQAWDADGGFVLFRDATMTVPGWFLLEQLRHPAWCEGWSIVGECRPTQLQPVANIVAAIDETMKTRFSDDAQEDRALKKLSLLIGTGLQSKRWNTRSAPIERCESAQAAADLQEAAWEAEDKARERLLWALEAAAVGLDSTDKDIAAAAARRVAKAERDCCAHAQTSIGVRTITADGNSRAIRYQVSDDGAVESVRGSEAVVTDRFLTRSATRELESGAKVMQHWMYSGMALSLYRQYMAIQKAAAAARAAGGDILVLGCRTDCWQTKEIKTPSGLVPRLHKSHAKLGDYAVYEATREGANICTRAPLSDEKRRARAPPQLSPPPRFVHDLVWRKEMGGRVLQLSGILQRWGVAMLTSKLAGAGKSYLAAATMKALFPDGGVVYASPTHALAGIVTAQKLGFEVVTQHKLLGVNPFAENGHGRPLSLCSKKGLIVDECALMSLSMRDELWTLIRAHPELKVLLVGDPNQIGPVQAGLRDMSPSMRTQCMSATWPQLCPARVTLEGSWRLSDRDGAMLGYLKSHVMTSETLLEDLRADPTQRPLEDRALEAFITRYGTADYFDEVYDAASFAADVERPADKSWYIWRTRPWLLPVATMGEAAALGSCHAITFLRQHARDMAAALYLAQHGTALPVVGSTWQAWLEHRKSYGKTWVYTQQKFQVAEVGDADVVMTYLCGDTTIKVPLSDMGRLFHPAHADNIDSVQGAEFSDPLLLCDLEHHHVTPAHVYTMLTRATDLRNLYEYRPPAPPTMTTEQQDAILEKRCASYMEQDAKAKRPAVDSAVDAAFFRAVYEKQRGACMDCGVHTQLVVSDAAWKAKWGKINDLATLDRSDCARGHCKNNIRGVTCLACNRGRAQRAARAGHVAAVDTDVEDDDDEMSDVELV